MGEYSSVTVNTRVCKCPDFSHSWRIGGNWRWPTYALCYISLSSSGLIPGRVKVRCRPGEGQEGQSQVCVMSRFKYKLKDFDLSYTLFRNIFLCPLLLSFHLPVGMETLTVHNMSDLTLSPSSIAPPVTSVWPARIRTFFPVSKSL